MPKNNYMASFHDQATASYVGKRTAEHSATQFIYTFKNFFHPFVGELIAKLNRESMADMLDPKWQDGLRWNSLIPKPDTQSMSFDDLWNDSLKLDNQTPSNYFRTLYDPAYPSTENATNEDDAVVNYSPKEIDVSVDGPYANYNWELFFHIPLTIAVHLSKNQRFAEAQRWFHYIFDPTSTDHKRQLKASA
jgi:hypothetical protein